MKRAPTGRSRWPVWAGYAAALWSLAYGALGLFWTLGGRGFPFGREGDFEADGVASVLADASSSVGAPVIAVLGLLGGIVGFAMIRGWGRGPVRVALMTFGWVVAVVLSVVLPDFRLLMLMTRLPFMPVWAFTGVPGGYTVADLIPWPRLNLLVLVIGGLLWALTTWSYQRRTKGACPACGRDGVHTSGWDTPESALRWGRWAVYVAVFVPMVYVATRVAWAVGIPLGIPQSFYDENVESGMFVAGLVIAAMAIGGCVLTLGLIQRWGEVYPRWIWFKKGKRVPPLLAIIPGSVIAVFVLSAGLTEIRMAVVHGAGVGADQWAMTGPGWLWPIWGVALGAATYAYYLRRRTTCGHCGLGPEAAPPLRTLKTQARAEAVHSA